MKCHITYGNLKVHVPYSSSLCMQNKTIEKMLFIIVSFITLSKTALPLFSFQKPKKVFLSVYYCSLLCNYVIRVGFFLYQKLCLCVQSSGRSSHSSSGLFMIFCRYCRFGILCYTCFYIFSRWYEKPS